MFFQSRRPDDDVVKIDMADAPDEMLKSLIHATLMCCRSVLAAHGHNRPLVESKWRADCVVRDGVLCKMGLKERISHVKFSEERSLRTVPEDRVDTGQWCVV